MATWGAYTWDHDPLRHPSDPSHVIVGGNVTVTGDGPHLTLAITSSSPLTNLTLAFTPQVIPSLHSYRLIECRID